MGNSVDVITSLWLKAQMENPADQNFRIDGGFGPEMKSRIVAGTLFPDGSDNELPFFCVKIRLTVQTANGVESGVAVVTVMRFQGEWIALLVPGERPAFYAEQHSKPVPEVLQCLISGKTFDNGITRMEAA